MKNQDSSKKQMKRHVRTAPQERQSTDIASRSHRKPSRFRAREEEPRSLQKQMKRHARTAPQVCQQEQLNLREYSRSDDKDHNATLPHLAFCPTTNEWADNAGGDPAGEARGEAVKLDTPRGSG